MKKKLFTFFETLRETYWFLPTIMTILAICLSFLMVWLDRRVGGRLLETIWFYVGGAEAARTLLSTVAGSMITIAGVTFSVTIVALSLASSQLGPRLLNNGILSIVVDEKMHILRKNFYATSSAKIPSTNFLPDNTMGMMEDPVNLLQVF